MNTIINRTNSVNFTTLKTASESDGTITRFASLVNLSKFALASEPERMDAIQSIRHAMEIYNMTPAQAEVLNKVIEILQIQ